MSPYPFVLVSSWGPEFIGPDDDDFIAWCRSRYADPESGAGVLVELRDSEREGVHQTWRRASPF
jgi:hypothetical protein